MRCAPIAVLEAVNTGVTRTRSLAAGFGTIREELGRVDTVSVRVSQETGRDRLDERLDRSFPFRVPGGRRRCRGGLLGEPARYNGSHPRLLGMIVERATGVPVTGWTWTRPRDPVETEFDGV